MRWFKRKKDKLLEIIEKQEKLIALLQEDNKKKPKEIVTILKPPSQENMEVYLSEISHFCNNNSVKWFFYQTERGFLAKMKESKELEFMNGMLCAIDVIMESLRDLDEKFKQVQSK